MRKQFIFSAAAAIVIPVLVYTASRAISNRIFAPAPSADVQDASTAVSDQQNQAAIQAAGKPVPYLPPEGLRGPGQVTELTRENQHRVREQLRGHKNPVFELVYSSADPRSQQMEAWVKQAANAYPSVTFVTLDTQKLPVGTPTPTINLSIPRPAKDFSRTGYLTDQELKKFLDDGLKTWTPIQGPLPPTPKPDNKSQVQHLPLPHFHTTPAPVPGKTPYQQ